MSVCLNRTGVKVDRSSYRRHASQFGLGIFPPEAPTAPMATITPSELQAQIAGDLVRIRELQQRQDSLAAKIRNDRRRAAWASRVDAIYGGIEL
jgi:transposase-like protein